MSSMVCKVVGGWLIERGFSWDAEIDGVDPDRWYVRDLVLDDTGDVVSGVEIFIGYWGVSVYRGSMLFGRVPFSDPDLFVKVEELVK